MKKEKLTELNRSASGTRVRLHGDSEQRKNKTRSSVSIGFDKKKTVAKERE